MLRKVMPLALVLGLVADARSDEKPASERATVDVALCLDVSGSMRGLIDSAKIKLWEVVNDIGKIKPTPNLRVSLYSYGHSTYDAQAGWVRKEVDLTVDLDSVYEKLNALTINGGTELVARVSRDAIDQQKWSEDARALKLIFVCGNEPANQDKMVSLEEVAKKAKAKGIVVNTIYCGPATGRDAPSWQELANLAGGQYASIDQNRNVLAQINAPQDKKLAELSAELNKTYIAYGGAEGEKARENQLLQDANARQLGGQAEATRASAKASGLYRNARWDLVDRFKNDPKLDLAKLAEDELCEEMKKMKPEEREKYVKDMLKKRDEIQKQIVELSKERDAYIQEEIKKNPSAEDKAFGAAVRKAIRDQAEAKGIDIPK
jgi:hypothetical protein